MKCNIPVLSVCLVGCSLVVHAQQPMPSVTLENIKVTLGAQEDKTIAQFRQKYKNVILATEPSASIRQWLIVSGKEMYSSPSLYVYAKNNRIIGVQVLQDIDSKDAAFDAVFALASKLSGEGRETCQISTWTGYLTGKVSLSKASVALECGVYQVILLKNQFKGSTGQLVSGYVLSESFGTITTSPPVYSTP
jgi:hypothetical protein